GGGGGGGGVGVIRRPLLPDFSDPLPQAGRRSPFTLAITPGVPLAIMPIAAIGIVRLLRLLLARAPTIPPLRISPLRISPLRIRRKQESKNYHSRGRSDEHQNAGSRPPATSTDYPSPDPHFGLFRGFQVQDFIETSQCTKGR